MHSQKYSPKRTHGDVLVIFEGQERLTWRAPNNGTAGVSSLWPDAVERQSVDRHLARQAPLLIIIDYDIGPVALLPEEVPSLPPEVRRLLEDEGGFPVLRVPLLDWLPEPLRLRGTAFMTAADEQLRNTPHAFLPDLLLDEETDQPVRFARRTSARSLSACRLGSAVRHLFQQRLRRRTTGVSTADPKPAPVSFPARRESLSPGITT